MVAAGTGSERPLLVAEELLLLLLDDETGRPTLDRTTLSFGLAGAVLAELALQGAVVVCDGSGNRGRLVAKDAPDLADEELRSARTVVRSWPGAAPGAVLAAPRRPSSIGFVPRWWTASDRRRGRGC